MKRTQGVTLVPREAPRSAMAKHERKKVTKMRERLFRFILQLETPSESSGGHWRLLQRLLEVTDDSLRVTP